MGFRPGFQGNLARALAISLALHGALALLLVLVKAVPVAPSGPGGPIPLALLDRPASTQPIAAQEVPGSSAEDQDPEPLAARTPRRPPRVAGRTPEPAPAGRVAPSPGATREPEVGTAPFHGEPAPGDGTEPEASGSGGSDGNGSTGISTGPGSGKTDGSGDPGDAVARERRNYALEVRRALERAGQYPLHARRLGLSGKVVLRIRVDPDGKVTETLLEATSRHSSLDRAAMASAVRLGNLPPPPGGAIDVLVPVVFTLHGTRDRRTN